MASRIINKLFVGNLPWTISRKELREHFSQFGKVVRADVAFDKKTGMSQHYGFVLFHHEDSNGFTNALKMQNHILEGNLLEISPSNERATRNWERDPIEKKNTFPNPKRTNFDLDEILD